MQDESGRFTVTFNGEIYNYRELREQLEAKGCRFTTESDTEVLLCAYAEWGPACVERFNGIFAFGLWDRADRTLLLARDHVGVKPLLYAGDHGGLIFGSELKAVLQHPAVDLSLDGEALSDFLSLGYILSPRTVLRQVRKLPPGTSLVWRDGSYRLHRYWDLAAIANRAPLRPRSFETATEELKGQLRRSVSAQLVSDVEVGALLSGGLDSSAIVHEMAAARTDTVKTFALGFSERSYDERSYASVVARHVGTDHYEAILSSDCDAMLTRFAWHMDEPLADTGAIATYALCRLARQHVKVALSGEGGDECFAGYDTYIADRLRSLYCRVPRAIRRGVVEPLVGLIPATHRKVSWDYKLRQFVRHAAGTPEAAHYGWKLLFTEAEKRALFAGGAFEAVPDDYDPLESYSAIYRDVPDGSPLNRALYVDMKTWLADNMLVKVDRASMACGLEARVPLLDPTLVEFAMSLPPAFKLRGFQSKVVLKAAVAPVLPRAIVARRKRGFNVPVAHWVDRFTERIHAKESVVFPGLHRTWDDLMTDHKARRCDNGFKLWTLLMWVLFEEAILSPSRALART